MRRLRFGHLHLVNKAGTLSAYMAGNDCFLRIDMGEDDVSISIPRALFSKLQEKMKGTRFPSVSDYATFLLSEDVLRTDQKIERTFTSGDEEKVKGRLRALGYIE